MVTKDHRQTVIAALARLGLLLQTEQSPYGGLPAQLIRYVENCWPIDDGGLVDDLRRERDAALARGNRLATILADIEASGGLLKPTAPGCVPAVAA